MPYTRDGKCVKKEGGATVKCHETVAQAEAHLTALRANVEAQEKTKYFQAYDQAEAGYLTVSMRSDQMCANCRWFMPESEYGPECRIVEGYPEPILATGRCEQWTLRRTAEEQKPKSLEIITDTKAHSMGDAGVTFLLDLRFDDLVKALQMLAVHAMDEGVQTVRWLPADRFHVTLVYAKIMDDAQVNAVMQRLPAIIEPMPIAITAIDTFDQGDQVVLILRVQPNEQLQALQRTIYEAAAATGATLSEFSAPDAWNPHITLAYAQPGITAPPLSQTVTTLPKALAVTREDYRNREYIHLPGGYRRPDEDMARSERASRLKRLVAQLVDRFKNKPFWEADQPSGFKTFGHKRWVAWWTNNWYDHEQEVFPRVAIDHYIKRVTDGQEPYPDLRFGHLPHTEHGKADWLGRVDNIVMATGFLDDSPLAHKFESYYREAPKRGIRIKVSHGFKYRPQMKIKGAYFDFTTFEISPIPEVGAFRAANPYTMWEVKTMTYPQEFRDELARALSDDGKTLDDAARARAEQMIAAAEGASKTAAAEGRQQKSATVTPADNAARLDALEQTLTEKFESFSTAFNDKMTKALTAFETGVQTNVKAADKFDAVDKKLETIEGQIAEINDWRKSQTELAPPPSRHKANVLSPNGAVAQWLTDEEAKTIETKGLSVVEQVLGQRVSAPAPEGGA